MQAKKLKFLAILGTSSLGLMMAGPASAQEGFSGVGSGSATVTFEEGSDSADLSIDWEGLAATVPDLSGTPYEALSNTDFIHAQHIHAGGEGRCPSPGEDTDGNGIIDTPEGLPAYGPVLVSATNEPGETGHPQTLDLANFPTGSSSSYSRTIDLGMDEETDAGTFNPAEEVRAENAVIVIHGIDPAITPGDSALEESPINDVNPDVELPLAATAPVLCGELVEASDGTFTADLRPINPVAQVSQMPEGGMATGGGSTANTGQATVWLPVLGGITIAAAAVVALTATRRSTSES